jgi:hypothetical protein
MMDNYAEALVAADRGMRRLEQWLREAGYPSDHVDAVIVERRVDIERKIAKAFGSVRQFN